MIDRMIITNFVYNQIIKNNSLIYHIVILDHSINKNTLMLNKKLISIFLVLIITAAQSTCDFYANQTGVMLQNYTNNYYNTLKPK